jgi:hypothetical protein
MEYLVIFENKAFYTNYFDKDKYQVGMTVFNMWEDVFTTDGKTWNEIDIDTL